MFSNFFHVRISDGFVLPYKRVHLAGLFISVVCKPVCRGYQSHLADFLLRINFNNLYNAE